MVWSRPRHSPVDQPRLRVGAEESVTRVVLLVENMRNDVSKRVETCTEAKEGMDLNVKSHRNQIAETPHVVKGSHGAPCHCKK